MSDGSDNGRGFGGGFVSGFVKGFVSAPAGNSAGADGLESLTGDVAAFRIYDVCQLLALAHSTGTLVLRAPGVRGAIYVEEGSVIGARSRPHPRRLGSLLRASGAVDEPALARAIASQIAGDRRALGEILIAAHVLSQDGLDTALATQARAALQALLLLPVGRFAFARGLLPPDGDRRLGGIDTRQLLLDALARLDELSAHHP